MRQSRIRLGTGSVFGLQNHFHFFGLPSARSEWPATGLGTGSVEAVKRKSLRKITFEPSAYRHINKGDGGLIIPWYKVRILAGPPFPQNSWRYGVGIEGCIVTWCMPRRDVETQVTDRDDPADVAGRDHGGHHHPYSIFNT